MLDDAISDIEALEHSIRSSKTRTDLEARLVLRSCLKELRSLVAVSVCPQKTALSDSELRLRG
jgi:hypothetical protein